MKFTIGLIACLALAFSSCEKVQKEEVTQYAVRDYRTVKLYLDTLNAQLQAQLDSTGTWTMQYENLTNGKKHLIFFGSSHVRDTSHPQFAQLARVFIDMKPQIAFNEGGQIPFDRHYPTMDSAIHSSGETGELKYLCDSIGIQMMNGDMDDKEEFAALQKKIPKDQIYLYMSIERYLNGYTQGFFPGITLEEGWKKKYIPYLLRSGFELSLQEQSLDTLKKIYKKYLHKDFSIDSLEAVHEYYLVNDGELGDVGRMTKIVRDEALLTKIDKALDQYDRVFVVFGGSHRIALAPALKQIINKERN
jgi:hypothetical protein